MQDTRSLPGESSGSPKPQCPDFPLANQGAPTTLMSSGSPRNPEMKRTSPLFPVLSVFAAMATIASAETITVCTKGCDHTSIQAAIDAAEEGDVIEIGAGVWMENTYSRKQLVLRGAGPDLTIIDGSDGPDGWTTCLTISEDFDGWETQERFRVESLTLRGGSGADIFGLVRGGGAYIEFVPVTFSNVVIEDCSIDNGQFGGIGGAICNYYGDVSVESSVLRNNSAYTLGGAIFSTNGRLQIVDSVLEGNIGEVEGGAVFGEESSVSIEGSTICNNSPVQIFGNYTDLGGNSISTECDAPVCPTDLTLDGVTDGADLTVLLNTWGACAGCFADIDDSGTVDGADLTIILNNWGACAN